MGRGGIVLLAITTLEISVYIQQTTSHNWAKKIHFHQQAPNLNIPHPDP
jgi:hypothetical protein